MTALLALALSAAPGCPEALAAAARLESPGQLGSEATAIAARLVERGAGGPATALQAEAAAFSQAARAGAAGLQGPAERFRARLARHCALAVERPAGAALRPGDRRSLEEILARAEFRRARSGSGALSRWLVELWRRILEVLGTEEAGRYAAGGRTAFFAAVALAAIAGLAWAVRRRRAPRVERQPLPEAASRLPAPDEGGEQALAAFGPRHLFERRGFLRVLRRLELKGWIPPGRALTNQELARHLAAQAGPPAVLAPDFADLAARFDLAIYGGAPTSGVHFLRRAQRLLDLIEAAP